MSANEQKTQQEFTEVKRSGIAPIDAWADRYGVPRRDAREIQRLLRRRHSQGTKECNGDPHRRVKDSTDKNACALAWGEDHGVTIGKINTIAAEHGLQVDYGTGLWGSVKKNGEYIGDVPG